MTPAQLWDEIGWANCIYTLTEEEKPLAIIRTSFKESLLFGVVSRSSWVACCLWMELGPNLITLDNGFPPIPILASLAVPEAPVILPRVVYK